MYAINGFPVIAKENFPVSQPSAPILYQIQNV